MKKTITSLFFFIAFGYAGLLAQIPNESPIPVDFKITSSSGYSNTFAYSSCSGAGWGTDTLTQTVSGQLVWAYDITPDSLCCDSIPTNLAGKMALIRRGVCNFSLKMLWAEKAGAVGVVIVNHTYNADGGGLVNMGAGDFGALVSLPAVFITRDDGDIIRAKVEAGETVTATFQVKSFGNPVAYYCLNTPVAGATPLKDIGITYINTGPNPIPSVTITTDITAPNGSTTTLTKTLTNLDGFSVTSVKMDDSYLPTMVGEYNVHFANSLSDDTFDKKFYITDYTYAQDNNVIDESVTGGVFNGTIEPSDANFVSRDLFVYDFGNFYRTGPQSVVATHLTFVLGSYNELWTGDPSADVFKIRIYDADPDGNGVVPSAAMNYDQLNESGPTNPPIGGADYILDGATPDFTRVTVELDEPVTLQANKIYLAMVQYDGVNAGIGIPPKPAIGIGTDENVAGGLSSARVGDRFYIDGWGASFHKFVVRLHVDGFTDAREEPLDKNKLSISPNPVSNSLNVNLDLEKTADKVDMRIMDFTGKLIKTERLENVQRGTYSLNVQDLAVGTYFLSVRTPEGFRAKKFVVAR